MKNLWNNTSQSKLFKRVTAWLLCFTLMLTYLPVSAVSVIDTGSKVADESTMNTWKDYFGRSDTAYAGAVWTDKSVFTDASAFSDVTTLADGSSNTITADPDNFLVALSAIASTSQVTGYSTTPTDTMLVLDVSGSMASTYSVGFTRQRQGNRYQYTEQTASDPEIVNAMVDATNDAIEQLLTLNEHNRVGVVLYSGNTVSAASNTSTGTLLLPLGRYEGVTVDGDVRYLSSDLTHVTQALYRRVSNNNYTSLGNVTYCSRIDVSLADGLKTEGGSNVTDTSKQVVGGTYIQNGLDIAWDQFKGRIDAVDTVIPEGKVQAGTKRMPIMVLMSDGSPTTATTAYNNIGNSQYGNGTTNHATASVGFLTQLTASWIRDQMATGYGTTPRFYTLGLGDAGTQATAIGVLNPSSASNNAAGYWSELLAANDGRVSLTLPRTDSQNGTQTVTVTKLDDTTLIKNYVNQYWFATDADDMVNAFTQIVDEIILQSKYYATLVQNGEHNIDGYITITDELGEFMEVKRVTGIVLGDTLYSGQEMAHALSTGILGTPSQSTPLGTEFVWTVMERMGIETVSEAQRLIDAAYNAKQLWSGDADHPASNYIGWYADEDGNFLGHWHDGHTEADYPETAAYINKSYGYLGKDASNLTSDMMHIVVKVSTNIANSHQAVSYQIPASLIPMITYTVTIDSDSLSTAQNITLRSDANVKNPMRLLFEVGLREGINPVTVSEIVGNSDHYHKNDDGSYSFYSNRWGITDLSDPTNPTSHLVATASFDPSMENEYYRFKEPETVLDASGNAVSSLDLSGNTQYYYQRQVVANTSGTAARVTNVLMPLSVKDVALAEYINGAYVIPIGTVNLPSNDVRITKTDLDPSTAKIDHPTNTLDYYSYPYGVHNTATNEFIMYAYLGNNGTFTITPATGLKLTKTVTEPIEGAANSFTFTVTLSEAAPNASVTDINGNEKASGWSVSDNVITLTVASDETVCIIGLPAGATYTVAEDTNAYRAAITPATGTIQNQTLIAVSAVNSPLQYGDLLISKEVTHPYEVDPDVLATKDFTFSIQLTGNDIAKDQTYESTLGTVKILDENGTVGLVDGNAIVLSNDESVTIYGLPEGTAYTVTETDIADGFALESINGNAQLTAATGSIVAKETATAAFVNQYPANDFSERILDILLNVEKILEDPDGHYTANEAFTFQLEEYDPSTQSYTPVETPIYVLANSTQQVSRTLRFSQVGTYHFRIVEIAGTTPGMTYSATKALFAITVTDENMDGQLEMKAVTEEANVTVTQTADTDGYIIEAEVSASFTNHYDLEATSTTLDVHKTLVNNTGVEKSTTEFRFQLFAADETGTITGSALHTVTTSALGDAAFTIPVENKGTFYYVVKEMIPEGTVTVNGKPVLNGMTYDPAQYLLKIVSEADDQGSLTVTEQTLTLIGGDSTTLPRAEFTNTYKLENAEWGFSLLKEMTGRNFQTSDAFTFYVERTDATFANAHENTALNKAYTLTFDTNDDSSVLSSVISLGYFEQVGTYYFRLYEANGGQTIDGVTYDSSVYHITVTVSDKGDGTLTASGVIHKLGTPEEVTGAPTFTNAYQVTGSADLTLSGVKTLNGRKLSAGEFSFQLSENGTVLQTVSNHTNGSYAFHNLTFTADQIGSTFTYTVTEVQGTLGGISYSKASYTVTVKVLDNGKGGVALDTTVVSSDNTTVSTNALNFTNSYTTRPVSVTLSGTKTLTGRELVDGEFTFELVDPATGNVLQSVTNKDGKFSFAPLYYSYTNESNNDLGIYNYVIREYVPALGSDDRMGGVWYDASTYEVQVSVTDLNGQMSAIVTVTKPGVGVVNANSIGFGNTYIVDGEAELALSGTKTLVGRALAEDEFFFLLKDADGDTLQSASNAADGSFAFEPLKFDESDIGTPITYTVTEWLPAQEDERIPGVVYDTKTYTIVVNVLDNGDGTVGLSYTVDGVSRDGLNEELDFLNAYASDATSVTLSGTKTISGDRTQLIASDIYTFELVDAATGQVIDTAINSADGKFSFDSLTFTYTDENINDLGDHYYIIREVQGTLGGITYSQTHYDVKIVISDGGGKLTALVVVQKNDSQTVSKNDIVFENIYTNSDEKTLELSGSKTLNGRVLGEKEFSFQLSKDGTLLQTVQNAADGSFAFDTLTYTIDDAGKTYTYTVSELIPDEKLPGVTYTDKVYTIVVTITDNGDGTLDLDYTIDSGAIDALDFVNTYTVSPTSVTFSGEKKMDGDRTELIETDIYTFELVDGSTGQVIDTKQNGTDGKFTFDAISYSYSDENTNDLGEHSYIIREVVGSNGGVTFDSTEYAITVTVTDEGGQLKAEVSISNGTEDVDDVIYTNLYAVVSTGITLEGTKELTGRELVNGEFQFSVLENGTEVATGTNNASGEIIFEEISYEGAGVHTYTVVEKIPEEPGTITYDATEYTVTVTVVDNNDGTLTATADYSAPIAFVNAFTPDPISVELQVDKTTSSDSDTELSPEGFQFVLSLEGHGEIDRQESDAEGKASFALTFGDGSEGTYSFTIHEVDTKETGVVYDETVHNITVTISKDPITGALSAVTTLNGTQTEQVVAAFHNTYEEPEIPETGDSFNMVLPLVLMALSAAALLVLIPKKKEI